MLLDVIDYVQILFTSIKSMHCLHPQSGFDLDAKTVLLNEKSEKSARSQRPALFFKGGVLGIDTCSIMHAE